MRETDKIWNLINRTILVAIIIMAGVGVALAFTPKVKELQEYQATHDKLQKRIITTLENEQDLKEKQRRFKTDPDYVRKVAHEIGYACTNEYIYHFPKEPGTN